MTDPPLQAQHGIEAVEKYKELKPDITTMDIVMPFKSRIEGTDPGGNTAEGQGGMPAGLDWVAMARAAASPSSLSAKGMTWPGTSSISSLRAASSAGWEKCWAADARHPARHRPDGPAWPSTPARSRCR